MRILVTGGSGYLGQFVAQALAAEHEVVPTWLASEAGSALQGGTLTYDQCNLADAAMVESLFQRLGPFEGVINTAALSVPGQCEAEPRTARAVNVPRPLLQALQKQKVAGGPDARLVHISTDQVYDGSHPHWTEDSPTMPVNEYGRSKLEAEQEIRESWPNHVILRSSIIYGPLPPVPVSRTLFVQFVEESLRMKKPCKFFSDEYRSPIFVKDLVSAIRFFLTDAPSDTLGQTFNAGGPDRLSRADMAYAIAAHCGMPRSLVDVAESAAVKRAAPSPLDISMDSGKLAGLLPFQLQAFPQALEQVFPPGPGQQQS